MYSRITGDVRAIARDQPVISLRGYLRENSVSALGKPFPIRDAMLVS